MHSWSPTLWSWQSGGAASLMRCCIIPIAAAKADSSGRRNELFVGRSKKLVKCLCGRSPFERLARSCIEGGGHGGEFIGTVYAQVCALWKILTQQTIGVLVGGTLPWALRIAEVDLQTCIDLQARMLSHLRSLIPGQRSSQLLGQGGDRARDCLANSFGSMACERRTILYLGFPTVTCHARQVQQHGEPSRALDQRSDGRAAKTQNEITLPMSGHRTVGDFYRALANHDLGRYEVLASPTCARSRHSEHPAGAQTGCQFAAERASTLDEQGLIDSLVADAHRGVVRKVDRQAASDLLRAPGTRPSAILPPSMPSPFPTYGRAMNTCSSKLLM